MWIVQIAPRRPYIFIVLALLIVLVGTFSILRTATDFFPEIRIPIVNVIWSYAGLPPEEMANPIVSFSERGAQTVVSDVEHTESQNLTGTALVKYYFRPNVNLDLAGGEHVDIGARVRQGQLLAEIDTPEVDQQLRQAQADLGTAVANERLARSTDERIRGLQVRVAGARPRP